MENKNHLRIVNLDNYVQPEIREKPSRDYVTFGEKNQFFNHLIERARGSVTNGGIISAVSNLVYGKGLDATDKARKPDEWAQMLSILKPKDIKRWIKDFENTGQFAIQCQWKGNHKKIATATHLPIETLAPEKVDEDGKIKNYYYARNWLKVRSMNDLTKIPVLGSSKEGIEILVVAPYEPGMFYFALPKWFSAIQWAELEEEIVNYHLNGVQNSFAPSLFISMNNGLPESDEEADKIVNRMLNKYQGSSNAGRVIVSFNTDKEHESTIVPVALSDLPEQYQFLSDESAYKILTAHSIPSPILVGLPSKTGFSSNAEELKTGSILMETYVLNPDRNVLIESFEEILTINGISLDIFFASLNPFAEEEKANIEAQTELSEEFDIDSFLSTLGEDSLDGYELIDEREVDYDTEDGFDLQVTEWNDDLNAVKLANTGTARPNANSDQDAKIKDKYFKVRYVYAEGVQKKKSGQPTREFCTKMTKAKKIYRKEDILQMSNKPVNPGFGEHGANTYSTWLYKGGARCHHRWLRQTYMSDTRTIDARSPLAKKISTNQAESKYKYRIRNPKEVAIIPNQMPHKGYSPNNPNIPKDAK